MSGDPAGPANGRKSVRRPNFYRYSKAAKRSFNAQRVTVGFAIACSFSSY